VDLSEFANDAESYESVCAEIDAALSTKSLVALINNAATQITGPVADLEATDLFETMSVNVVAPFLMSRYCLDKLTAVRGTIINIGSIHARLTKPEFVAYATSKGALEAMTRAMAVELGEKIRVIGISPAAVSTRMLEAGFQDNPDMLDSLRSYHPTNSIGECAEVAGLAYSLVENEMPFLNGSIIDLSGGISSRLHDPC
jgi:NAD(P)-dependent dehydrogenase (short-subunit alcohol dehydrogenase family)